MIIGHKKQIKFLEKSAEKNNISQAYIFSGPESVGKFTIAKMFANKIIKESEKSIKSFEEKKDDLSDLIILKPEIEEKKGVTKEKEIKVEKIRNAQKELFLYPSVGKYRILIINDAHKLNQASQNALLKTLEEPSSTAVVILITHKENDLLSTIKSRCQKIQFNLVATEDMKNFKSAKNEIIFFSMGRPGVMKKMIEDKESLRVGKDAFKELKKIFSSNVSEKMILAEKYSKNALLTSKKMEFWIWILWVQAHKPNQEKEKISQLFQIIERIEDSLKVLSDTNVNSRLTIENLFLNL